METTETFGGEVARATVLGRAGRFVLHFLEMCAPMCVSFAVGDLVYFWAAGSAGYSEPFTELPEVSVLVVTFTMTAPMTALMLVRACPGGRSPRCPRPCRCSPSRSSSSAGPAWCGWAISRCSSTG
jgi:hypothetical protein